MYSLYLDSELVPITPNAIDMKVNNKNTTISLVDGSEFSVLTLAGLTTIEFTLVLPQFKMPYARYENGFKSAHYFLEKFEKMKQEKKPFQFILIRQKPNNENLFDTNMKVSLEDYKINEKATNAFDIQVKITLKQYVFKSTQKAILTTDSEGKVIASFENTRDTTTKPKQATYTVTEEGESLIYICKKYLGDDSLYRDIAKLNNITNVNNVPKGTVLRFS